MHRRGHDVGGLQGVHYSFPVQVVPYSTDLPEIGRGDVDFALHCFHGRHDILIGDVDGGTLTKRG
jgi:hypothetical protein